MLNHYQKTYFEVLAELLDKAISMPDQSKRMAILREKLDEKSYLLNTDSNPRTDERLCEYLVEYFNCAERTEAVMEVVKQAKLLTPQRILNAPYRVASDFGEASTIAIEFVHDENKQAIMFGVDTGGATKAYSFFKTPYNEGIDFIYGNEHSPSGSPVCPGQEMKYVGFYSKSNGKAYCLEEPLEGLYWFRQRHSDLPESKDALHAAIIKGIQREVVRRVLEHVSETPEQPDADSLKNAVSEAKKAYVQGETSFDFADKIEVSRWLINGTDLIRYVEAPAALVEEKSARILQDTGMSAFSRLWAAHCAEQQILDQIMSLGGLPSEWNSVHKPLREYDLHRMGGKPVYAVANSEYNNVCKWCIVTAGTHLSLEGTPLVERLYNKNWIAFDHEPPREIIEAWQASH